MSDQLGSSRLRVLFEAALEDYRGQTGIALAGHPLATQLQSCDSVDSVTAVLHEQTQVFGESGRRDKIVKPIKNALSVLYKISAIASFDRVVTSLYFPPVKAVQTGLAILLFVAKGVLDSYDALVDLLELIEQLINRLDIYTKVPPTVAMTETVVKILMELLATLALATKHIKQGKPLAKQLVKKLLETMDLEAVLRRLDRLTHDEARMAAAQILEIVYRIVQNMGVLMDDGKVSVDHLKNALEIMHELASEVNKSKRDKMEQDIRYWLSSPDPWKNYHLSRKSRHRGTARWFVQGNTFLEWKYSEVPGSLLWIHGKPGAGKSVLCSSMIEDVDAMRKTGLASLAFFYCDFRDDQKRDLHGLLSSLLVQLCHQSDSYSDLLSKFYSEHYSEHTKSLRHPSDDALLECLKDLLKLPGLAPVYLFVDALDECSNTSAIPSPRDDVLSLIEKLIKSQIPSLRICVTSRPEIDIRDVLDPLIPCSVSLHDEDEQKRDIEEYIKSVVFTDPKMRRWSAADKELVIEVLTRKADGMFRWVYCQLEYLRRHLPGRIRHELGDLPETLDETYARTLRDIDKGNWEFAHRLLQFITVASRPLRVKEVSELLSFDFEGGRIPEFLEDWRLEDPVDAVLSTCSSLLAVIDVEGSPIVQFSHFSVKEYLTSERLATANDITCRYHISMTPAHTLAAQACLGILLRLDKDVITSDSLEDFPFAKYAAEHWFHHTHFEGVSRNVEDGMKQLFDPDKPHLAVCIWIDDPDILPWERSPRSERPLPPRRTPLHYAALWGLYSIIEFLVIEHLQDVGSRCFTDNATPLHLASRNGHLKAVVKLIERGADVVAEDKNGSTSLHLALQWGQAGVAHKLIERDANVTAQNKVGSTPLHLASLRGQVETTHMLIEYGAVVTGQDKGGWTPLHLASRGGHGEIARMLIECSTDVTAQNKLGSTPLHLASVRGQVDVARVLIAHGADVTAQNKVGWTSLHLASREGQLEVARVLIECGADVTVQNEAGWAPLHLASLQGQLEVARMLIQRGASLMAEIKDKSTPLHLASLRGQLEVANMLIEHGADLTAQNEVGSTPLHLALQEGQVEVALMLIERGADVTIRNKVGQTPLHFASIRGQLEVTRMLIECGADVTARNEDGSTPLHLASTPSYWTRKSPQQYAEIARTLLDHSADATAQDKYGSTPFRLASWGGLEEVTRVLPQDGADAGAHEDMD